MLSLDKLRTVQPSELYDTGIWDEVWSLLNKAVEFGDNEYDEESVFRSIVNRESQLWVHEDGEIISAATTNIVEYPCKKICLVHLCGAKDSKIYNWLDFIDVISNWAKSLGCESIESRGRKGWGKVLANKGFKFKYEVTRRKL